MKKILFIMLSALFAVSAAVKAEVINGTVNGSINWKYDTETCVLTLSGSGAMPNYESASNTPWAQHKLGKKSTIKSDMEYLIVGEGITSIGNYSFAGTDYLVEVILPNSVKSIGSNAFDGCGELTAVHTEEGVSLNANLEVAEKAFNGTGLFQNNVLYLDDNKLLVQVSINYVGSLDVNPSTKRISPNAFANCVNLTAVTIPSSVTSIGADAFEGCSNLTTVTFNANVKTFGNWFEGLANLTTINIPASVTTISNNAFDGCTSLTNVTFGNISNITTWGSNIFSGVPGKEVGDYKMIGNSVILDVVNTGKKKYTISPNVAYIAENAFAGCSKVEYLDLSDCQRPPKLATGALTDVPTTKTTLVKLSYEGNFGSSWGNVNTTKIQIYNNRFVSRTFLHNAVVPSDVAVYRAEVADNKVKLIKVENYGNSVIVKAGVGVFLRTTATGEKVFNTGGNADYTDNGLISNNKLMPVTDDVTLKAGMNAYIIATVNGVQDFYLVNGDYPLSMGKAYLDGTELSGSKLQFMDTDGIDEVSSAPMHKTQIFNINGQRLSSPKEGLNIINGKKVIVNN